MKQILETFSWCCEVFLRLAFSWILTEQRIRGLTPIRALPDITSSLEVWKIVKIQTVRKPDVFLPGRRTFNTLKNRKKIQTFFSQVKCLKT